uniref:Uncharacterized protein n=1 Tax=viral metagenome TaxID=1070528 RepID=A0A6C0HYL3_9ZZZZ
MGFNLGKAFRDVGKKLKKTFSGVTKTVDALTGLVNDVKMLINCTIAFFNFVVSLISYVWKSTIWFFIYFLPWIGQYFECIFQKIIFLPKCFFWYLLDSISWISYVPFRILFWIIDTIFNLGVEDFVNKYFWGTLEDLDKYIHDEKGLGTKIHIIHFPDSVTDKCYNCHIKPIRRKLPSTCDLNKKHNALVNCRKGGKSSKKCNVDLSAYFDSQNPTDVPNLGSE